MLTNNFANKILEELSDRGPLRFKELLRVVRNPRTLSKKLRQLSSLSLINSEEGVYRLTEKGMKAAELTLRLRKLLEGPQAEAKNIERIPHRLYGELLRRYFHILWENYQERLLGVAVFGSVARGDWNLDSDIDLMIVAQGWDGKPIWERMRELINLKEGLKQTDEYRNSLKSGYRPIIQHYPIDAKEASKFHRIYLDACIDSIIIYEKERFLTNLMEKVKERLVSLKAKRLTTPSGRHYWVLPEIKAGEASQL
ncbi:nucleotidyltransferase domain-containing protein [Candidatus Bathyarchaeota archaeon]|nr:nucleotidyltransferase domain-containing protein [Candidatus Bathyarchaeota archaeon]